MKCPDCGLRILDEESGCPDPFCKTGNRPTPGARQGTQNRAGLNQVQGMVSREVESQRILSFRKRNRWKAVKWFLFSLAIGGIAGSAVAIEYDRSTSPIEEIPNLIAAIEPVNPRGLISVVQIPRSSPGSSPGSSPELVPTPAPTTTPTPPVLVPTPTPIYFADSEILAMNDRGEISNVEAIRLLSKVIYEGESGGELIDEAKAILERVWTEEGQGEKLYVTFSHDPINSLDTDGIFQLEFEEPNKVTFVIADEPTDISNGVVYAMSFASLAMASANDPTNVPDSTYRSIYEYATDHEVAEIRHDCGRTNLSYCSLFTEYSRSPE